MDGVIQDKTAETVDIVVDCGAATEKTRGSPLLIFYELGIPPFDTMLL